MKSLFSFIILTVVTLSSCQETKDFILDSPMSKITGISDTWKLSQVVQIDVLTKIQERREMDISSLSIGADPMTLNFTSDGNYTVNAGSSLNYLGSTSGTWSFNDNDYPTQVNINSNGETTVLQLFAPTREIDMQLKIGVFRYCGLPDDNGVLQAEITSGYIYVFDRQ